MDTCADQVMEMGAEKWGAVEEEEKAKKVAQIFLQHTGWLLSGMSVVLAR